MATISIAQCTDTEQLPAFAGLALDRISVPGTPAEFALAAAQISAWPEVGFDTESKPTFKPGERSTGPHLLQFATPERAYLFQVGIEGCDTAAKALLESDQLLKIGFGLGSDRSRLQAKLGIQLRHYLDLGTTLRYAGKKGQVGLRGAVAAVLRAAISKSRRVSTSNWANSALSEPQQRYAANDAYAALLVYLALDEPTRTSLRRGKVAAPTSP